MGHQGFSNWPVSAISNVAIATASTLLLPENLKRQFLVISNPTTYPVWINFGAAAVLDQGIPLGPGSVQVFDMKENQRDSWQMRSVYAIADGATAGIAIFEQSTP